MRPCGGIRDICQPSSQSPMPSSSEPSALEDLHLFKVGKGRDVPAVSVNADDTPASDGGELDPSARDLTCTSVTEVLAGGLLDHAEEKAEQEPTLFKEASTKTMEVYPIHIFVAGSEVMIGQCVFCSCTFTNVISKGILFAEAACCSASVFSSSSSDVEVFKMLNKSKKLFNEAKFQGETQTAESSLSHGCHVILRRLKSCTCSTASGWLPRFVFSLKSVMEVVRLHLLSLIPRKQLLLQFLHMHETTNLRADSLEPMIATFHSAFDPLVPLTRPPPTPGRR